MKIAPLFRRSALIAALAVGTCMGGEKLEPIFDGKTFNGWVQKGGAIFAIEDGVIIGKTGDRSMGWLCTERSYGDFVLELEVKITDGNSGIQIRSRFDPEKGKEMIGDQVEVDLTPRAWSGGLYDQGRRGWLQNLTNNPAAQAAFNTNEWNKYRIECEGDSIKTWVNGVPATDYRDAMDVDGFIALQVHSGAKAEVRFRNIRLQEKGRHEWKPLWDGKTFQGWRPANGGGWQVAGGMISATNSGRLVLDKPLSDFVVRLKCRVASGNGSVRFRMDEQAKDGLGITLNTTQESGGLQGPGGRAWREAKAMNSEKWFQPKGWNTLLIYSRGENVAVDLGRYRTVQITDAPGPAKGLLALEVPAGAGNEIYFKDIEVLEKSR